jgi:hypothetical protein
MIYRVVALISGVLMLDAAAADPTGGSFGFDVVALIQQLGVLGFALVAIFGAQRGLYKWRRDHEEIVTGMVKAHADVVAGLQAQLTAQIETTATVMALKNAEVQRERERADKYEGMTLRLLDTANKAASVAADAAKGAITDRGAM